MTFWGLEDESQDGIQTMTKYLTLLQMYEINSLTRVNEKGTDLNK